MDYVAIAWWDRGEVGCIESESVEGVPYLVKIVVEKLPDVKRGVEVLSELKRRVEARFPGLRVLDITAKGRVINMVVIEEMSPISWAEFVVFIPEILTMLGLVVTLVAVVVAVSYLPGWLVALILLGIFMVMAGGWLERVRTKVVRKAWREVSV